MKTIVFSSAALIAVIASAAPKVDLSKLTPEQKTAMKETFKNRAERSYGGFIRKKDSASGCFAVVNAQDKIKVDDVTVPVDFIGKHLKFNYRIIPGQRLDRIPNDSDVKATKSELVVFILDTPAIPMALLVAPEERWAVVNLNPLAVDSPSYTLLASRTKKEISRAMGHLLGAGCGNNQSSVLGPVSKLKELDALPQENLPFSCFSESSEYMKGFGVFPYIETTYLQACKQGWAPQPTNDIQKAIWEKIHAPPTKPIKITYDKDRQKPVVK